MFIVEECIDILHPIRHQRNLAHLWHRSPRDSANTRKIRDLAIFRDVECSRSTHSPAYAPDVCSDCLAGTTLVHPPIRRRRRHRCCSLLLLERRGNLGLLPDDLMQANRQIKNRQNNVMQLYYCNCS